MELAEKAAYLKGLIEGLGVDERVKAGPDEPVLCIKIREIDRRKAYAQGY